MTDLTGQTRLLLSPTGHQVSCNLGEQGVTTRLKFWVDLHPSGVNVLSRHNAPFKIYFV